MHGLIWVLPVSDILLPFFACNKSISGHSLTNFCYLCVVGREKSVDCKRHLAWFFILKSPI